MGRGDSQAAEFSAETREWLKLGEICNGHPIPEQTQYVSRYLGGHGGMPDLSKGVRYQGDWGDYHAMLIHRDDAPLFIERVTRYKDLVWNDLAAAKAYAEEIASS